MGQLGFGFVCGLRIEAQPWFMQFTMELVASPLKKDQHSAYTLFRDWLFARARLWAEVVTKLYYFRQLPWHIIGIAHHQVDVARRVAKRCLHLFDSGAWGCDHRQSQRFLDPNFIGHDSSDIPLRPLVEKFAFANADLMTEEMKPLCRWLARLATIRVAERSVEGIRSLITKVYRRAPAAQMSYVSVELRLPSVLQILKSPSVVDLGNNLCFHGC